MSCKRDMLKYMYWRTAKPTRDWVGSAQPFDFHRADWNSPVGPTLLVSGQRKVVEAGCKLRPCLGRSTGARWATASRSRGASTGSAARPTRTSCWARRRVRPWHCFSSCAFAHDHVQAGAVLTRLGGAWLVARRPAVAAEQRRWAVGLAGGAAAGDGRRGGLHAAATRRRPGSQAIDLLKCARMPSGRLLGRNSLSAHIHHTPA